MDENNVSNSISFTVTDINEQALTITYTSSDSSLISSSGITFSGDRVSSSGGVYTVTTSSESSSITLTITPESNQSGTCTITITITITVTDPDGMTATSPFTLTVTDVMNAPTLATTAQTSGNEMSFTCTTNVSTSVSISVNKFFI